MTEPTYHVPVMLAESVEGLDIRPGGVYLDATFGGGGHSRAILERLGPEGRLVAFDQDADAERNLPQGDPRVTFVRHNFRYMAFFLRYLGIGKVDGILADLGVSSHHFDSQDRGFSFRFDAPLDMRMNRSRALTAADVVNQYPAEKLAQVLADYGEVERPWQVAAAVVARRAQGPISATGQLCQALEGEIPERFRNKALAKIFQALRIEVNGEMDALRELLEQAAGALAPRGRLAVITYHSLEDRLVKNFIRSGNFAGELEKDFYGNVVAPLQPVNRRVITPTPAEVERNPRSRSAKLRIASRTVYGTQPDDHAR